MLILRLKQVSKLHLRQKKWIFNFPKIISQLIRMTMILGTLKRISLPKTLLLIHYHYHQVDTSFS